MIFSMHMHKLFFKFASSKKNCLTCSISDLQARDHGGCSAIHYAANINSPLKEEIIHMMAEALSHTGAHIHSVQHERDRRSDILNTLQVRGRNHRSAALIIFPINTIGNYNICNVNEVTCWDKPINYHHT